MRKTIVLVALLVGAAAPGGSSAAVNARWLTQPTCTASATALTCTGRVAGLNKNRAVAFPGTYAWIWATMHYTCSDDPAVTGLSGSFQGDPATGDAVKNGQPFTITLTPRVAPDFPLGDCPSGTWLRDPSYYDVSLTVSEGWEFNPVLSASFGTVSP